jgi:hypothetical protein
MSMREPAEYGNDEVPIPVVALYLNRRLRSQAIHELIVDHLDSSFGLRLKCKNIVLGRADPNPNWKGSFDGK